MGIIWDIMGWVHDRDRSTMGIYSSDIIQRYNGERIQRGAIDIYDMNQKKPKKEGTALWQRSCSYAVASDFGETSPSFRRVT